MSALRRPSVAAAVVIGALLICQLFAVSSFGSLPRDDYYGLLSRLCGADGFLDTPRSFLEARINQHRVTLPAMLWRLNVAATGGDNRVTGLVALGFLTALLALCWRRLSPELTARDRRIASVFLPLAMLGPHHAYNLAKSFGGTHSFLADLLTLAAVAVFLGPPREGRPAGFAPARWALVWLLGLLGILSFSSALVLWPALLFLCVWLRRPWWDWLATFLGGGLSTAIFLHGWKSGPAGLPAPEVLADYLAVFLGALPGLAPEASRWIGIAGLIMAIVLTLLLLLRTRPGDSVRTDSAFWMAAAAYACGNGLLAGLGRAAAGGAAQAVAPRYSFFPSLFWISLAMLAWLRISPEKGPEKRRRIALSLTSALILAGLFGGATVQGLKTSFEFREQARWQRVVVDQLRNDAWDIPLLRISLSPFPKAVVSEKRLRLFKSLGHVPWNRPAHWPDRQLDPRRLGEPAEGQLTEIVATTHSDIVRVGGWIPRGLGLREVVFADATGRQRSQIHLWPHRRHGDRLHWAGLVRWHDDWRRWTPFVLDDEGGLRPLGVADHVTAQWRQIRSTRNPEP